MFENILLENILPTNDVAFKQIFWNKEYPEVLISFINAVLKRDAPITSVQLGNTELIPESNGKHSVRLDLVGKTSNNEILNIEMQKNNNDNMLKRSLYYWSKLYAAQLPEGEQYKELNPVITINILDFDLFDDNVCNRSFILKNTKTNEEYMNLTHMLEIHFVELRKRQYLDDNDELFAWAEFLKSPNSKSLISKNPVIDVVLTAKEIFNKTIADPTQRLIIQSLEKEEMDKKSAIAYAHDDGVAEGKKETATNMLKDGLPSEVVAKYTGLPIAVINSIIL